MAYLWEKIHFLLKQYDNETIFSDIYAVCSIFPESIVLYNLMTYNACY